MEQVCEIFSYLYDVVVYCFQFKLNELQVLNKFIKWFLMFLVGLECFVFFNV